MKINLEIRNTEGEVIYVFTEEDFDDTKPLVFSLKVEKKGKMFYDAKVLRITNSNVKLVLS
uniref:Uncharacterized protein n=1 Tax=viral metagenome TaxID=1070528 RepID=A0A6H1ZQF1_9ZZZZ